MSDIYKRISREDALNSQPEEYQRGYYDGYHKGYAEKKSAVREEVKAYLETLEVSSLYPFSMIYEITETKEPIMLSLETITNALVSTLNERERRILEMHYRDGMTLENIGAREGVSKERIRQLLAKAVRKMKNPRFIKRMEVMPKSDYIELETKYEALLSDYEEWKEEWKEQHAVETRTDTSIRHTPIEKLELSVRSYNCLKRAKKDTVGDVIDMTFDEMLHIRNLGRRSAEEIANRLAGMGLHNATIERTQNE